MTFMKPDAPRRRSIHRFFIVAGLAVAAVVAALLLFGNDDAPLEVWNREAPASEFTADRATPDFDFDDYLHLENTVFSELRNLLREKVHGGPGMETSRYLPGGPNDPETFPQNWNRTFVIENEDPRGAALLLHGLTDSPYSLRTIGERLANEGFLVVGLRLPGHGTVPEALDRVDVEDWSAAVRIAARYAASLRRPGTEFVVVGYSNGAALGLEYALDALDDETLPAPDRLVMLSPAIGITRFAALAGLPHTLSFLPLPDHFRWTDVLPEIDPFKYNSFPANGGYQTHRLTVANRKRIARLAADGRAGALPPILAFVSLADSTVRMEAVAADLMQPLGDPRSELVVFDVNRTAAIAALLAFDPVARLEWLAEQAPLAWNLTVIGNENSDSRRVVERRWAAGTNDEIVTDLGLEWPSGVYSLSHVAVPFSPADPLYGPSPDPDRGWGLSLGNLEPRGEKRMLRLPMDTIMRLRFNPFFDDMERRILAFVGIKTGASIEDAVQEDREN